MPKHRDHLVIPDCQVKPGVPLDYLEWIGQYIVQEQPEVIVHLGDFADLPSLSSYDRGTKGYEGRRYKADVASVIKAQEILLRPLIQLQLQQRAKKTKIYKPDMYMLLGNHEYRIERAINADPHRLEGIISYADLQYERFGWKVSPYLKLVDIDGVLYTHYVSNKNSDTPKASSKAAVQELLNSVTAGHRQCLDIYVQYNGNKQQVWGITAGACYLHYEDYKGAQGNDHWRGIIHKYNVRNGEYDPKIISLDSLKEMFA